MPSRRRESPLSRKRFVSAALPAKRALTLQSIRSLLLMKRTTRLCVPHVSSEHQRLPPLREVSRKSQPQFSPIHSRTVRRSFSLTIKSEAANATPICMQRQRAFRHGSSDEFIERSALKPARVSRKPRHDDPLLQGAPHIVHRLCAEGIKPEPAPRWQRCYPLRAGTRTARLSLGRWQRRVGAGDRRALPGRTNLVASKLTPHKPI